LVQDRVRLAFLIVESCADVWVSARDGREVEGRARLAPVFVRDAVVAGTVIVAFAAFVTVHVALSFRLAMRHPRWRGLVALLLPPFAPIWGFREGLTRHGWAWVIVLGLYVLARFAAQF